MPLRNCARTISPTSDDYALTQSGPFGRLKPTRAAAELHLNQTQARTRYPLGLGHALAENMGRAAIHERYTAGFIKRRLGVDWLGVWDRVTKVARRSHNVAITAGHRQVAQ